MMFFGIVFALYFLRPSGTSGLHNIIMNTLSAHFDEMTTLGGVVYFLQNFGIFTQNQLFSIYYVKFLYFVVNIPLTMSLLCLYV